jgi:hypothetical protein
MALTPDSDLAAMEMAGFYEIRTMNLNIAIAANIATRESDLTHGNAEEMAAGWISSKPASFVQDERMTPEEQDSRQHSWAFLLIGALLFLVSESILSNLRLGTNTVANRQSSIVNRKLS